MSNESPKEKNEKKKMFEEVTVEAATPVNDGNFN